MLDDSPPLETLTADEAAALLGVKRATLYTYVSRGAVRTLPDPEHKRRRRYVLADVLRLKRRSDARSGHGAVAAGALDWGEPVLQTAIARIDPRRGPRYRTRFATELAEEGTSFEAVAELLLGFPLPALSAASHAAHAVVHQVADPVAAFPALAAAALAARTAALPSRHDPAADADIAAEVVGTLLATLGVSPAASSRSVAHRLWDVLRQVPSNRTSRPEFAVDDAVAWMDRLLVLCAEHELNASTFTARVAASAGADLLSCVVAALATFSGPKHGAGSLRVEAFIDEALGHPDAARALRARRARGERVPGAGHPLYPDGDPRARLIIDRLRAAADGADPWLRRGLALADALTDGPPPRGGAPASRPQPHAPNLDFALALAVRALALPRGSGAVVFALGRSVGWLAHALEQRASGALLRPRARFVGPPLDGRPLTGADDTGGLTDRGA